MFNLDSAPNMLGDLIVALADEKEDVSPACAIGPLTVVRMRNYVVNVAPVGLLVDQFEDAETAHAAYLEMVQIAQHERDAHEATHGLDPDLFDMIKPEDFQDWPTV
jgi:hypothetical protein